jgi:fructuronate reductase
MARLSDGSWTKPRYDRAVVRSGVVHLGLGAFHRAHQAPVFDALIAGGDPRWGVTAVATRSAGLARTLTAQDGLYSLSTRDRDEASIAVVGAIRRLLVAAREPEAVVAALAHPDTHLVTLTVTEKGYSEEGPNSPVGLIARALERRRLAGLEPLTILSCDNRSDNGQVARAFVIVAAVEAGIPDAGIAWTDEAARFPSSMIDRITPAPTAEMIDESSAKLGLRDEAAVWTEPFWQWVVEDRFAGERPDFAAAGVQLVDDVRPFEAAKLRLLNAAHSALAYVGLLRGHRFVHLAIADPELAGLVDRLWDEAATTLDPVAIDIPAYRAALLRRFSNSALPHVLLQIAADGSQKLPPRILAPMAERAGKGLASPALAAVVAGWAQALATVDGLADPLIDRLRPIARRGGPAVRDLLEAIDPTVASLLTPEP